MLRKSMLIAAMLSSILSVSSVIAAETSATLHHRTHVVHAVKEDTNAPVNINSADVKTLMTLKFIGKKRAAAIVAYRDKNGPFTSADDLKKVKGITQKIIDTNKDRLRFS